MKLKDKLVARMVELAGEKDSGWEVVPGTVGATIRWTKEEVTPEYHRGTGFGRWDQDTYSTHVFITLVAGKFIMRTSAAPWVQCHDTEVPLWLVELILEDPALGLDSPRQWQLKAARRDARASKP